MQHNAILICDTDTVVTVLTFVPAGTAVTWTDGTTPILAQADIPIYHKISIQSIAKGQALYKYGECIGYATQPILAGDYVHTHNLASLAPTETETTSAPTEPRHAQVYPTGGNKQ